MENQSNANIENILSAISALSAIVQKQTEMLSQIIANTCQEQVLLVKAREELDRKIKLSQSDAESLFRRTQSTKIEVVNAIKAATENLGKQLEKISVEQISEVVAERLFERLSTEFKEMVWEYHQEKLDIGIKNLGLKVKLLGQLESYGVKTIRDLVNNTEEEILEIPGIAKMQLNQIKRALKPFGFQLRAYSIDA